MLPEEELMPFLAFRLAGENVTEWRYIMENMTCLDLFEAYAYRRTSIWMALEDKD